MGFAFNPQFDEAFKRKYDILQQHADIEGAEQVAKAPYYASAAQENVAKANLYPSMAEENIAKARLYPSMSTENIAKAGYYGGEEEGRRLTTGIARQKWEDFERPKLTGELGTFRELTPLQRELKKKEMLMMGKAYDSPGFAEKLFGIEGNKTSAVARPRVPIVGAGQEPSLWQIGSDLDEERAGWKPTGIGPADWLARRGRNIVTAVPRMLGAGMYGLSRSSFWND